MAYTVQYSDLVLGAFLAGVAVGAAVTYFTAVPTVAALVACGVAAVNLPRDLRRGPVNGVEDRAREIERVRVDPIHLD